MKKLNFFQRIHTLLWTIYSPKRYRLYHYSLSIGFGQESSYLSSKNSNQELVDFLIK